MAGECSVGLWLTMPGDDQRCRNRAATIVALDVFLKPPARRAAATLSFQVCADHAEQLRALGVVKETE